MKKFWCLIAACSVIFCTLCACAPIVRLEERLIIRSMAVDYDGEYIVSVQSYRSKEEGGEEFELVTARGDSVYESLGRLEEISGRLPFYSELAVIIVGDSAVRQGMNRLLSGFVQENEIRMGVYVFYAGQSAADLLTLEEATSPDEELIAVAKAQLSAPVLDASRLYNVVGRIQGEGQDALLPILYTRQEEGGQDYMVDRVLCFRDEPPAAVLDAQQTETLGWALGGISTENIFLRDPQGEDVFFRPVNASNRIDFALDGDNLSLVLKIKQSLEFLPLHPGAVSERQRDERLERSHVELQRQMQERLDALIDLVFCSSGSDVFLFGVHLRQQQPRYWKQAGERAAQAVHSVRPEVKIHLQIEEG